MTGGCLLKLAARTAARANHGGCSFEQLNTGRRLVAMANMQRVTTRSRLHGAAVCPDANSLGCGPHPRVANAGPPERRW